MLSTSYSVILLRHLVIPKSGTRNQSRYLWLVWVVPINLSLIIIQIKITSSFSSKLVTKLVKVLV